MDATQYIFVNAGLGMLQGKLGAQAGHAAVEGYRRSKPALIDAWYEGGHYKKLVMEARDETHLLVIEHYLNARGFRTSLVIDEGMTEVARHTATALGVEIVDKDDPHVAATFESFKLLPPAEPNYDWDPHAFAWGYPLAVFVNVNGRLVNATRAIHLDARSATFTIDGGQLLDAIDPSFPIG